MKKYFKIFKISLISYLEYRVNFVLSFLFSLVPFSVSVLLWVAVAKHSEFIKVKEVVSYYFVILIVKNITTTNSIIRFSDDIRLGELNKYLLKPYNYCFYNLMADLPERIVFIVMNFIPLILILALSICPINNRTDIIHISLNTSHIALVIVSCIESSFKFILYNKVVVHQIFLYYFYTKHINVLLSL